MANQLRLEGLTVSPSGVRGVWLRHDLETRLKRLLRLKQAVAQDATLVLAEKQVRLLERRADPPRACRPARDARTTATWTPSTS